jgi:arylsulfatase A-like enzyme
MNLILLALDTLRADHLGCYGYSRNTSPFLDEFARAGALFENYFAATVPTHPSFTSLFTGMDSFGHQVTNVKGEHTLSEDIPTLAEVLRDAGYQTAAVDTMGLWMSRGFDVYENPGYHVNNEQPYDCGYGRTRRDKNFGAAVTRKAAEVAAALSADRPFFLFVHYWDPHQPYYPPAPYHELYYAGNPCDPACRSMRKVWAFDAKRPWLEKWMDRAVTDADYWVAQYDGEINYTDDQVKALCEALQRCGLLLRCPIGEWKSATLSPGQQQHSFAHAASAVQQNQLRRARAPPGDKRIQECEFSFSVDEHGILTSCKLL